MRRPPGPRAARSAGPRAPTAPALTKRRVILDLFAGEGGVGRRCKRYGYHVIKYELNDGPEFDLTSPTVLAFIEKLIRSGKVHAVMLATPCTSFSVARDRTRPIRSRTRPWGLPHQNDADRERLRVGNSCARATIQIMK